MKHQLERLFLERLSSGLKRKSINSASKWAENYRIMGGKSFPGPWRFKYHPWLRDMHDSTAELNIGQKAAQMGFTEMVLNVTFYKIDVEGTDCLYVLPSKTPDASDFSSARFDPALELSPHLSNLFSNVKNVGHKRAGSANLYVRGAQSKSGLRSIPVGLIVADEVDVMNQDNIPLLVERVSGQLESIIWMISTPTLSEMGINKYFNLSTQDHYHFKCPSCTRFTELIYPDCLKITADNITDTSIENSHLICKECKNELLHEKEAKADWLSTAKWIPTYSDRSDRGFHISQLYSCTVKPSTLAKAHFRAMVNPADEQELWNSKLGLTHAVEGAQINDEQINECRVGYKNNASPPSGLITMGIDVGKWLHYEVDQWFLPKKLKTIDIADQCMCKVVHFGKVKTFDELDQVFRKYKVLFAVIDANPEKREALKFANRFYGFVKLCYYGRGVAGKTINIGKDPSEPTVTVDRTAQLDSSLGRFKNKRIMIPVDIDIEYRSHMKALTRLYEKDKDGNPVGRYVKPDHIPDHYAHARNYSEIALTFALGNKTSQDVGKVM
jgi:hypothetical protein